MPATSRLVVVANRLPVNRVRRNGESEWHISPGGLVSALIPILQQERGIWIGWAGTKGSVPAPFEHESITNVPVPISRGELEDYYEGFSNRTLWPLYHDAVRSPEFHRRWWWPYVKVNRRFAEAAARHTEEGGTVWVQDYHLQLVPGMLREKRPDLKVGFFLHIPMPPQELFAQLPWRREILTGLLGADVVGFQTRRGAQNFAQLCRRFTHAEGRTGELTFESRRVRYGAFPISVDVDRFERLAQQEDVQIQAEAIRRRLGHGRKIILGVDRMDYTKGIDIRMRAFGELLERSDLSADECVLVQSAVPSREAVDDYADLRGAVEQLVGKINGTHGKLGRVPIHYLHQNLPIEELVGLYLAADVMLVTPLRDGMNLVCKEFVSTRLDNTGVLVLSEFAGAAKELQGALQVNPHDIDGLAAKMLMALSLPTEEVEKRMRAMRQSVKLNDVYRWAETFLNALSE